jgi:hypothetical protein
MQIFLAYSSLLAEICDIPTAYWQETDTARAAFSVSKANHECFYSMLMIAIFNHEVLENLWSERSNECTAILLYKNVQNF